MNYKTILVHLDPSPRSAARAALAARWARAFGSHLVGLVPTGLYDGVIPVEVISSDPEDTVAASDGYLRRRSDAIALAFKNSIAAEGPLSSEVRPSDDPTVDALVRHGHTSDLVVLGQDGADDHRDTTPHRLVDPVLLALGRPVLVLPSVGTVSDMPRHALVGWDGSRAAAVALGAAIPVLRGADRVTLVSLRHPGDAAAPPDWQIPELLAFLHRHGVRAAAESDVVETGLADALLSRVADYGADLLVVGAYGHGRLRERVLGGVTRQLLAEMTVPLLTAH